MIEIIREDDSNPGFFSVKNNCHKRILHYSQTVPRKVIKVFTPGSYSLRRDDNLNKSDARSSLGNCQEIILAETQPLDPYSVTDPGPSSSYMYSVHGPSSEVSKENVFPMNKKRKVLRGDKKLSKQEKLIKREQDILKAVEYYKKGN